MKSFNFKDGNFVLLFEFMTITSTPSDYFLPSNTASLLPIVDDFFFQTWVLLRGILNQLKV